MVLQCQEMIGFLSPDGTLYKCNSFGHLDVAKEICMHNHNHNVSAGIEAEDYLLHNGYICIRANDAYRSVWNNDKYIPMTKEQIEYLNNNEDKYNHNQWKDIVDMIEYNKLWIGNIKDDTDTTNIKED